MDDESTPGAIWERLWRRGELHSCPGAYAGNYDGSVLAFWNLAFARGRPGGLVVDLGTGNGAVALLAQAWSRARNLGWQVHGADLADIDPLRARPHDRAALAPIEFHPRTPIESLPFAPATVELACSQFAFEYAPQAPAIAELARVMVPGGHLAMVLHSDDSFVCAATRQQLEHADWVLDVSGLLDLTRQVARELAPGGSGDAAGLRTLLERLHALGCEAEARAARGGAADFLLKVREVVATTLQQAPRNPAEVTAEWLERVCSGLHDERARLRAMNNAALDERAFAALTERLAAAVSGRARTGTIAHESGGRLGWTLEVECGAR